MWQHFLNFQWHFPVGEEIQMIWAIWSDYMLQEMLPTCGNHKENLIFQPLRNDIVLLDNRRHNNNKQKKKHFILSFSVLFPFPTSWILCLSASLLSEQRQKRRSEDDEEVRGRRVKKVLEEEEALSLWYQESIVGFLLLSFCFLFFTDCHHKLC